MKNTKKTTKKTAKATPKAVAKKATAQLERKAKGGVVRKRGAPSKFNARKYENARKDVFNLPSNEY